MPSIVIYFSRAGENYVNGEIFNERSLSALFYSIFPFISVFFKKWVFFYFSICYNEIVISSQCSLEDEVQKMAVSYKKLFKILIDRDMKKKEFRDFVGISYSTMSKLEKGENTTVEVLEKICLKLGCGIEDIMEILPDTTISKGAE